eukprot:505931_1
MSSFSNALLSILFIFALCLLINGNRNLLMFEVETIIDLDSAVSNKQQFMIYNPNSDRYLFVSNDETKSDNIVALYAHKYHEMRNIFQIEKLTDGQYRLYNVDYKRWLFVSNDHVLEVGSSFTETRNVFAIQQAPTYPPGYNMIMQYG